MLDSLLELTASEYGFLGEVLYGDDNQPYLVTHALTDISWNEDTKELYDANMAKGFEFHNLNTLFGVTLATGETVISNAPDKDPRAGGLPKGHPDMKSYLGVPIKHRDEMLGMLGIANRNGGYEQEIVDAMKPLLVTAGSMIQSIRSINARRAIECELQGKHKLLNGVIHNITDALVITDHNGVIREVNKATEETFGYFWPELLGSNIGLCLDDESKVISRQECMETMQRPVQLIADENIEHAHSVASHVTISVGLAMRMEATNDASVIYAHADEALYEAKKRGRNQL